jgi:prepilin-type N-terminal cleavage/methylation domain-containing protein
MMGFRPVLSRRLARSHKLKAFTLFELMIVASIIGIIAGLAVPEAFRSLQRSKVNEVALELAGWLESLKVNSTADVSCVATFNQAMAQSFRGGSVLYSISSIQQTGSNVILAPPCTSYIQDFKISLSDISGLFRIVSPASFRFTRRGNVIAPDNGDIKIFLVGSTYMRCLRFQSLLGTISIGENNQAASEASACPDDSFTAF